MTTQIPTWRDQSTPGIPGGDRATPGTVVGGRYELRTPIGNGGMGTVWRATDGLLRRDVAVKEVLLPPTMPQAERDALYERTMREARAAAALSHPSVVQVYDVVTDGVRPWIVMELLEARSLADMVIEDGPLAARGVAKIGIAMLGALEVAHAAGVLHRDVKPANVLVCADGRCVLTDFGVARLPTESKLTTPGMVLGSPHFISPERAVGGTFGPPSDLFSLGVTLYTAVEGGPPFDRGDPFETMRAVVEEQPRPARLAGVLQPVLWGLLEKDPARRWGVDQSRAALRELLDGPLSRGGTPHARADTDPYAVITQVSDAPPPALRVPPQVGGRAMLDPNKPLTGQLTALRRPDRAPRTIPSTGTGEWDQPPRRGGDERDQPPRHGGGEGWDQPSRHGGGEGWDQPSRHGDDEWDQPPRRREGGRREGVGRRRAPSGGAVLAERVAGRARSITHQARGGPRGAMLAGLAGALILLALLLFAVATGWFAQPASTPGPPVSTKTGKPSSSARIPLIPVQEFRDDRGIVVNVPKGWTKSTSGSYVDFTDPAGGRKIRINIEKTSSTAKKFLQAAESGLKNPSRCAAPYTQVGLRDATLAGKAGAELEYTCGVDPDMRHGLWRAIVVDGKAYHFYVTVPDAQFAQSKVIFDEMVASFQLV